MTAAWRNLQPAPRSSSPPPEPFERRRAWQVAGTTSSGLQMPVGEFAGGEASGGIGNSSDFLERFCIRLSLRGQVQLVPTASVEDDGARHAGRRGWRREAQFGGLVVIG